jgi:hypothetical protein
MEKMLSFPEKRVRDLGGLYFTLQKAGYAVRNVGVDGFGTYIYLEDTEEKDPVALVDEWVKKPAPNPNDPKALAARKAEAKKAEEAAVSARAAEEAARIAASAAEKAAADAASQAATALEAGGDPILLAAVEPPSAPAEAPKKEPLLKRIWNAIW